MMARVRYECIIYDISMFKRRIEQQTTMFHDVTFNFSFLLRRYVFSKIRIQFEILVFKVTTTREKYNYRCKEDR